MQNSTIIKMSLKKISSTAHIAPNIPSYRVSQEKVNKLMRELNEDLDYLVGVIDATALTGSLKVGMVFFEDCFYFSNQGNKYQKIYYKELNKVQFTPYKANPHEFWPYKDKCTLYTNTGQQVELAECLRGTNCSEFEKMMMDIVRYSDKNSIRTRQNTLLHELPEKIKLLYICVLYNYYNFVTEAEKPEISSLIRNFFTRMEFSAETRYQAKNYCDNADSRMKTGALLKMMETELSDSDYELIRYALMQDIIFLENANTEKTDSTQAFVNSLKNALKISNDQNILICKAVQLHSNLLKDTSRDSNYTEFGLKMDELREAAVFCTIPLSSLICAGSVYAPSTFHKLKSFWGNKSALNLQRELMLKSVIENNQMTINFLIEDLNQLSIKLMQEIQKSNTTYLKINKLANELQKIQQKNFKLEKAVIINKLADEKYQRIIQNSIFDKYIVRNGNKIQLHTDISYEELRQLKSMLERLEEKYE